MEPDSRRTIDTLQAGRAIAAFVVLLHHIGPWAYQYDRSVPGLGILERGYVGVDFFFVLSGFIIYHATVEKKRSIRGFATARLRRVLVPYLPIGLLAAVLYARFPGLQYEPRDWSWLTSLTLLPLKPGPALSVAWTLQHEMFFYFVFALLYFSRMLWPGLAIWLAAIVLWPTGGIPLNPINVEFMLGIVVAVIYRRGIGHWLLVPAAAALMALWLLLGGLEQQRLIVGFACAILTLEVALLEQKGAIRTPAWLVFMGAASYALYLTHDLVLPVATRLSPHSWPIIFATDLLACLTVGISYYWFFERPLLKVLRKERPIKRDTATGAPA
jgi:exopolysaccharide production protein ExoZ